MKKEAELQSLALVVHTVLCAFHALGIIYNFRRGNKRDVLIHSAAFAYDAHSAHKHFKAVKEAT